MTPEIKKRIEQIQRGEVPRGYQKRASGIVPRDWVEYSLGEIYTERKMPGDPSLPILTVSIHSGVSDGALDEDELGKSVKRIEDKTQYKTAHTGDLVFNMMRAWQGAIGVARSDGLVSPAYIVATPEPEVYPPFMDYCFKMPQMINKIHRQSYGVTDFRLRLYWDSFVPIRCSLPPLTEQKRIVEILSIQDKVIELKEQLLFERHRQKEDVLKELITGNRRLPGYNNRWRTVELEEVFDYIQPTPYLVQSTDYSDDYQTPVLTAGKTFILGYTNERNGIYNCLPVVIFDDFTTASKFVDFPFKAKSSAMKILKIRDGFNIVFAFEAMQLINYTVTDHERHWISKYSKLTIEVPELDEQDAIAQVINNLNCEISLLQSALDQEKEKKKALMQLLLTGIVRV